MTLILQESVNWLQVVEEVGQTVVLLDQPAVNNFVGGSAIQRSLLFQYNNVSTRSISDIEAGKRIVAVQIGVITPWDVASTVTVGDSGDSDRLMTASQSILAEANVYEAHPFHKYVSATTVNIYLSTGVGATQGEAQVILYLDS
jgi:hypothetical protein